ncbi:MAG: S8 family serine peptidase [Desulfobacteraceae bacterium]|nr:S8 family serine peptidase [Desulfobacteraceae bacterium]
MKKIISIGILSLLMILFTNYIAKAQDYVPNEVLIKFKKGVGKQARKAAIKSVQGKKIGTFKLDPDLLHLEVPAAIGTDIAISHLTRNPNVKYAARNDIYYIDQDQTFPDDPRFHFQWSLHNTGRGRGTAGADINAPEAWDIFRGSHEIIVAVLDTGVDYNHEDLAANIWINEPEYYGTTGVDDDGNTYIDDIYGWDFAYNDNDPMDVRGHGTACAGIIGAVGNNGLGVTGINWTVRIMCVKVHKDSGGATSGAIINGIHYAIKNGAHITSNSYGCEDCYNDAVRDAIVMAHDAGILFVASAGNDGWSTDLYPHYPSSYNHENIISVTATDNKDNQRYNWGLETVDMAGCSPRITTTRPGNTYDYGFSGTSAACPHIAGVAALVKGYEPSLTHMEVKTRLMDTVRLVPSLTGLCVTEGTVNAYSALSAGGPPPLPPDAPSGLTANVPECNQIDLTWLDNSDNEDGFEIERGLDGVDFAHIGTVGAGATSYSDTTVAENTTYYYRVRAYNTGGDSAYSEIDSSTTPFCSSEPPAAPTGLAAKARGKNKIALNWQDNSNNEDGFKIYRGPSPTSLSLLEPVGADTTSYVDSGVAPKTTYYYKVCAYNTNGENCSDSVNAKTK